MHKHDKLNIEIFNDPMFYENGMLLWIDDEPDCWIVDPGLPPQPDGFISSIEQKQLARPAILLTHCHGDHIAGIPAIRDRFPDIQILCPRGEEEMLTNADANLSAPFGMPVSAPPADQIVAPGETVMLCDLIWHILDVSGHSPGGVAYYCPHVGVALVGDALFADSIGRYDFPHSDRERLLRNIEENLLSLPDETTIYAGHGPPSTIGQIKVGNWTLLAELNR